MYTRFFFENTALVVSIFALVWFLAGVWMGFVLRARNGAKKPRRAGKSGSTEIYVGNLSYDVEEKDLQKAFKQFGEVLSARVIRNKANGKSKGYGFVRMGDSSAAGDAIRSLEGTQLKGRRIVANEAKSQAR
ncbi:MAG: hypothetical protein R6V03_04575 [Kiritimatiellia bacterium]